MPTRSGAKTTGRILLALLVAAVLLLVVVVGGINALDNDRARRWVLPRVQSLTGLHVTIPGRIETSLGRYFELRLGAGKLSNPVPDAPSTEPPALNASWQELTMRVDPWEIFLGRLAIEYITVVSPETTLTTKGQAEEPTDPPQKDQPLDLPLDIVVRDVSIKDATLALHNEGRRSDITLSSLGGQLALKEGGKYPSLATDIRLGALTLHQPSQGAEGPVEETAEEAIDEEIPEANEPKSAFIEELYALLSTPSLALDTVKVSIDSLNSGELKPRGLKLALRWTPDIFDSSVAFTEPPVSTSFLVNVPDKHIEVDADLQNFQIAPAINDALAFDLLPDSIEKDIVTGTLNVRVDLSTTGDQVKPLLTNLNGNIYAVLEDGSLDATVVEVLGFDVAETAVSFLADNPNTSLPCMVADLPVREGVINGDQVLAVTVDSRLKGQGEINLAEGTIDYTLATFAQDVSPLSVPAPIHMEGKLSSPKLSVETGTLLKEIATSVFQPAQALVQWFQGEDSEQVEEQRKQSSHNRCAELLSH